MKSATPKPWSSHPPRGGGPTGLVGHRATTVGSIFVATVFASSILLLTDVICRIMPVFVTTSGGMSSCWRDARRTGSCGTNQSDNLAVDLGQRNRLALLPALRLWGNDDPLVPALRSLNALWCDRLVVRILDNSTPADCSARPSCKKGIPLLLPRPPLPSARRRRSAGKPV
jgi:hypothetical protein